LWDHYKTHLVDIQELAQKLCCVNRELKQIRYYFSPLIRAIDPVLASEQQKYVATISKDNNVFLCEGKYIKKPITLPRKVYSKISPYIRKEELKGYIEKGIDVQIAVDMICLQNEYDAAILVSTDSDFVPVLKYLQNIPKKKIQVAAFEDKDHSCFDLKEHCKSFINLHHFIPSILRSQKIGP
jgi:uncharacterized LabA/DUF88 family protein